MQSQDFTVIADSSADTSMISFHLNSIYHTASYGVMAIWCLWSPQGSLIADLLVTLHSHNQQFTVMCTRLNTIALYTDVHVSQGVILGLYIVYYNKKLFKFQGDQA